MGDAEMTEAQKRKAEKAMRQKSMEPTSEEGATEGDAEEQRMAKRRGGQEGNLYANQPMPPPQGAAATAAAGALTPQQLEEQRTAAARGAAAASAAKPAAKEDDRMADVPDAVEMTARLEGESSKTAETEESALALQITGLIDTAKQFQQLSLDGRLRYKPSDFPSPATGDATGIPELPRPPEKGGPINMQARYDAVTWRTEGGRLLPILSLESFQRHMEGLCALQIRPMAPPGIAPTAEQMVERMRWMAAPPAVQARLNADDRAKVPIGTNLTDAERAAAELARATETAAAMQIAKDGGWELDADSEPDQQALAKARYRLGKQASFHIETGRFDARQRWLAMAEGLNKLFKPDLPDLATRALIHFLDIALDQVELFDKFCLLNWEQWVTKGWSALWEEEMGHLLGWKYTDVGGTCEDEEVDEEEADEEHIPFPQQEQLYAKMEEYDAGLAHTGGKAVYTTLDAGVAEEVVMVRPLEDPNRPLPTARTPAQAVQAMNLAYGRGSKVKTNHAKQILEEQAPPPFEGLSFPPEGTWVNIAIHYLHRAYVRGDSRFGSPILSRRKIVRTFRNRGVSSRDITIYQASKGADMPTEVDCKGQFLVNKEFKEWMRGERDVWFGDRKHNTMTHLWGSHTPPGAVWVPIEGVDGELTDHVAGLHAANPQKWTYQRIMQFLHHKIRKAGWKEAGVCKAEPTRIVNGKPQQAPWLGRDARYLVQSSSANEAEAYSGVFTAANPVKCYTGANKYTSKHHIGLVFAPRYAGDDEAFDETGLIVVAMNPTLLSDWELLNATREALGLEEVTKHSLEDALLERIHTDLPWSVPYLVRVMAMEGPTGHWDQGWVLLFWRESGRLLCRAFCMMVAKTTAGQSEEGAGEGDPHRVDWSDTGQPIIHTRYDCWVGRYAGAHSTSGLVAIMQDPRSKDFKPPAYDTLPWASSKTEAAIGQATVLIDIPWKRKEMPRQFPAKMPAALLDTPGSYKTHADVARLQNCITEVDNLIPEEGDEIWFPAYGYGAESAKGQEEADLCWAELAPKEHTDGRKQTMGHPGLVGALADRNLFYEALSRMMGSGMVKIKAEDHGLVITQMVKQRRTKTVGKMPTALLGGGVQVKVSGIPSRAGAKAPSQAKAQSAAAVTGPTGGGKISTRGWERVRDKPTLTAPNIAPRMVLLAEEEAEGEPPPAAK